MARLPWFAFYPSDWFRDTRCLSLAARGAWIDICGILWDSKTRGVKSLDMTGWASEIGKPLKQIRRVFDELRNREVATIVTDGNGNVTVTSRRQVREEKERESTRLRVTRFRNGQCNGGSNGPVTVQKSESDVRRQNQKKNEKHAMPVEWMLTDTMTGYGAKYGMTCTTIDHEFVKCKQHHLESKFTVKGWDSNVWQTWVLNWVSYGRRQVSPITALTTEKCYWRNDGPCEENAIPGSKYCQKHKDVITRQQERVGHG